MDSDGTLSTSVRLRFRAVAAMIAVAIVLCLLVAVLQRQKSLDRAAIPVPYAAADGTLPDGAYAVLREGVDGDKVEGLRGPYRILADAAADGTIERIAVSMHAFLPLQLASAPLLGDGGNGHPMVSMQLAPELEPALEAFTAKYRQIAIVLDGNVVTRHKVHGPICGGAVKITRCEDDKCAVIFAEID